MNRKKLLVLTVSSLFLMIPLLRVSAGSNTANLQGTIDSIINTESEQSLIVQGPKVETTVEIHDYTFLLRTGNLSSNLDDWKIGDRVVVRGKMSDKVLHANVIRNQSLLPGAVASNSKISSINANANQVIVAKGSKSYTLDVDAETDIIIGPLLDQKISDLAVGDTVAKAFGPMRKDDPISARRIVVTGRSHDPSVYAYIQGTVERVSDNTLYLKSGGESMTLTLTESTRYFNKNFIDAQKDDLQPDDSVDLWTTTDDSIVWIRMTAVENVSTRGVFGTIIGLNEESKEFTLSWVGNFVNVKTNDKTKFIVGRNVNAKFSDLTVGTVVIGRGKVDHRDKVITASRIIAPAGKMNHKTGTGSGEIRFQGKGQATFTGNGVVTAGVKVGSVVIEDKNGDAKISTTGKGEAVELGQGLVRYEGYGSLTVEGSDVVVVIEGSKINGVARGTGSYWLSGSGKYKVGNGKPISLPVSGTLLTVTE